MALPPSVRICSTIPAAMPSGPWLLRVLLPLLQLKLQEVTNARQHRLAAGDDVARAVPHHKALQGKGSNGRGHERRQG